MTERIVLDSTMKNGVGRGGQAGAPSPPEPHLQLCYDGLVFGVKSGGPAYVMKALGLIDFPRIAPPVSQPPSITPVPSVTSARPGV